jgi:hypothetical protein
MTHIFIYRTSRPYKKYKTGICYTCDHAKFPNGRVIDPSTDKNATYNAKTGKYTCGVCNLDNLKKTTALLNRQKGNFVVR